MKYKTATRIADMLTDIAELLSDQQCQIKADELLECMESRTISKQTAEEIRKCFYD